MVLVFLEDIRMVIRACNRALVCLVVCGAVIEGGFHGTMGIGGWLTYWDLDRGLAVTRAPRSALDEVLLFAVHLDPTGTPTYAGPPVDYPKLVRELRELDYRVWLSVVNDVGGEGPEERRLKDPEIIQQILSDPERQADHRARILRLASAAGFSGVDIDYENLYAGDRDQFTLFIRDLANEARAAGLALSVTVQPKLEESSSPGPGAMDWAGLCEHVDRLQIMLYNLHNRNTPPGPMATPEWVAKVLGYARRQCDVTRIVPVLKVSGMRWGPHGVDAVQHDEAVRLLRMHDVELLRDPTDLVPYFTYVEGDSEHIVYFEDVKSLSEKMSIIESLGFGRVVLWSLGRQDPGLLAALGKRYGHPPDRIPKGRSLRNETVRKNSSGN